MIDPFKQILDKHADAQGWDADTREHVLLQFVANAQDLVGAAVDLDTFLADLTAEPEPTDDARHRCYGHVEQLENMISSGSYDPSLAHWRTLDTLLGDLVRKLTTDTLLAPADGPRYYIELSVPLPPPQTMGFLGETKERAIASAFTAIPTTLFDGAGSGEGYRQFFGTTREPGAVAADLTGFLPTEGQLSLRRLDPKDDRDA